MAAGYEPVSFRGFGGGLNLRDKEDAIDETEALDALNVEFTTRGAVKQRNGYAKFTSSALTNRGASIFPFYTTAGVKNVIVGCGTRLEAVDSTGAVVASNTGLTSAVWDCARMGQPGNQRVYCGNGTDLLQRWNGVAWTSVASTPKGGALDVMAVDQGNRLVVGGFDTTTGGPTGGASTSNPSRVYFSDPGDPDTWQTNNYVDFTPGDGETIMAVQAWREFVFIFKETKFFVVYGTSTDAAGSPIFNYRTIDGGAGVASRRAVAVAPDGVYFMSRRGVYRSTGAEAELVSAAVDPIFLGSPSGFYNGGILNHVQIAQCAMGAHEQRIYLAFPSGTSSTNNRVLVYDITQGWWSLYDFPASSLTSFRIADQAELVFTYATGNNDLGRHSSSYTDDAGAAISSRWRSGWFDYDLSQEKTIRESKLWGSGACFMSISRDFDLGTGQQDLITFSSGSTNYWNTGFWNISTWGGTNAGLTEKLRRRAIRGTAFSTLFSNATLNQPWSVHRLTHHLREQRIPSISVT